MFHSRFLLLHFSTINSFHSRLSPTNWRSKLICEEILSFSFARSCWRKVSHEKKFSVFCWYDKSTLWNEEVGRKQTSWMITPLTKRRLIMKKFYCVSIEFRPHSEFAELERGFNSFLSPLRYSLVCYAYHKFGTWNEQFSNVSDDNLSSPMLVTNLLLRLWFKEELLN